MGAIENKLRSQNKELKAKLDDLRAGVNRDYEAKLTALRDNHLQARSRTAAEHATELNKLREAKDEHIQTLQSEMDGLRERYEDRGELIKTQQQRATNLEAEVESLKGKLDEASKEPKKLRERLQRVRDEKDASIRELRQDLQEARDKARNVWLPPDTLQRRAALRELRTVAMKAATGMATPEEALKLPVLLDALEA